LAEKPERVIMNIQPNRTTALVTGGTGFVGAYVIRDLITAGYSVKALRRKSTYPSFIDKSVLDKVQWLDGDILDTIGLDEAMKNTDAVIHSAAKVSFWKKERSDLFKTNIEGTANVVNAAIENNVKRFIHVSSVAAIGRRRDGSMLDENIKWTDSKLNSNYAISKYHAEMEVWRGIAEGLNAVIVNPSTVLGYGDWNTSSCAIFKSVYDGFPWYTNGVNGFVDVEDVSQVIMNFLQSDISAERFIVSGDNWSYRKVFDTIANEMGKRKPYREATPFLAAVAWRMEKLKSLITGKRPLLTRETARVGQSNTYLNNNKILNALPEFRFTPLEETIRKACKQYIV
jgi:nucleoside-diphosphate-sugar epimerase